MIPQSMVAWVVPLIAAGTVIGIGYYTVKTVGKLEEWKEGAENRLVRLETADAIRRDREDRE